MYAAKNWYKIDPDQNRRTLPTFDVGQLVYVNSPPRAVLPSETNKVATASYKKLMLRVSGPYKTTTVRDYILTIFKDCVENTTNIDRATRSSTLNKRHHVEANDDNILENHLLAQIVETAEAHSNWHFVEKRVGRVLRDGVKKYVEHWYGYFTEEGTMKPPHYLWNRFDNSYSQRQKTNSTGGNRESASPTREPAHRGTTTKQSLRSGKLKNPLIDIANSLRPTL